MADSTDYLKWLERARQDIKLIEVIHKEGLEGLEDSFCYTCHQAAEKLLKAVIVKNEQMSPRSHDLLYLLGISIKYNSTMLALTDALTVLNAYSISARYPNDFQENRTVEEAEEVYSHICLVNHIVTFSLDQ